MRNDQTVITQPDFFPWLGAFDKMKKCDVFVFLDHVTNRPGDGIWTKRVKILINKEPRWLTVPLKKDKERDTVPINEMIIDFENNPQLTFQHLSTIKMNYSRAPFYKEALPLIEEFYSLPEIKIAKKNEWFIKTLSEKLGILKSVFLSSELNCSKNSNELLIEICEKIGTQNYIHGEGSLNYLQPGLWKDHKINLIVQGFTPREYTQYNRMEFAAGLSVIDVLMNIGFAGTSKLLNSNYQK
jgi:hypothetical protein